MGETVEQAETAVQRAHRVIRDRIVDGTHPDGSMLSENLLAADLGMSRTPVRSALLRLEEEGWITAPRRRATGSSDAVASGVCHAGTWAARTITDLLSTTALSGLLDQNSR